MKSLRDAMISGRGLITKWIKISVKIATRLSGLKIGFLRFAVAIVCLVGCIRSYLTIALKA